MCYKRSPIPFHMHKEQNHPSYNKESIKISNPQVKEILGKVEKITGRSIKLSQNIPKELKNRLLGSTHPYFQKEKDFVIIMLNDNKIVSSHLNYLIIHECSHILRLHEVPPNEWRTGVIKPFNIENFIIDKPEIQNEIKELIKQYKQAKSKNPIKNLNNHSFLRETIFGVMGAVNRIPEEIQIDKNIWENYDQVKDEQRKYLEELIPEYIGKIHHFNLIEKKVLPPNLKYFKQVETIFLAAYLNFAVKLLGAESLLKKLGTTKYYENRKGKEILGEILNVKNQGYKDTCALAEKYLHQFSLKNYITYIVGKENIERFFS